MTTQLWCLVALAIIPYILAGIGGYYRGKQFGSPDNEYPRIQCANLEGKGARAWAAQLNAWEALALFTAAIVVAEFAGANPEKVATAALVFLTVRILHAICYLQNLATLRSIFAVVGLGTCIYIFYLANIA